MPREITCDNFEISLVVFVPNVTTNHADYLYKTAGDLLTAAQGVRGGEEENSWAVKRGRPSKKV